MKSFFNDQNFKASITTYIKVIKKQPTQGEFEEKRNSFISWLLSDMVTNPISWDEKTPFNKKFISHHFKKRIEEADMSKESIDQLYSIVFRFAVEEHINHPYDDDDIDFIELKEFSRLHLNFFSQTASGQIEFALSDMGLSILRHLMTSEELSDIKKTGDFKKSIEQLHVDWNAELDKQKIETDSVRKKWKSDLEETEDRVNQLQETLINQRNAFNFVGLYRGFESLSDTKVKQLYWARLFLVGLGLLVLGVIFFEIVSFHKAKEENNGLHDYLSLIPVSSLVLVLIYYFRVSLMNFNSIRAQIMQIELRKSLCQFIQNYADYSSSIKSKDSNLLDKFEDIIFSNIMSSEDKIPSTFDGLEQIVSLINAVKNKGK
ncbi:hypothetical protein HFD92_00850 [Pantoea sp. EKM101V]|uniref:hypothetical protein n=1 Tax=Pantoea sp. EKM101V TaxID=1683695 RepID=UPI00142E2A89|nr:hypothetical protein [Pantoea sp. EKM101V]KAF6668803.1 hypothetical protein HFD92_00850 [Pantoea sp. EKM101V]